MQATHLMRRFSALYRCPTRYAVASIWRAVENVAAVGSLLLFVLCFGTNLLYAGKDILPKAELLEKVAQHVSRGIKQFDRTGYDRPVLEHVLCSVVVTRVRSPALYHLALRERSI